MGEAETISAVDYSDPSYALFDNGGIRKAGPRSWFETTQTSRWSGCLHLQAMYGPESFREHENSPSHRAAYTGLRN